MRECVPKRKKQAKKATPRIAHYMHTHMRSHTHARRPIYTLVHAHARFPPPPPCLLIRLVCSLVLQAKWPDERATKATKAFTSTSAATATTSIAASTSAGSDGKGGIRRRCSLQSKGSDRAHSKGKAREGGWWGSLAGSYFKTEKKSIK